ncbi:MULTISPECIES: methionine ABC transporter ATP-binding protein MetN [Vibrio]|jgi:D-methionine transport system ATP-binding protein|uniref:D-methionine ABC transporter, ATP-binding protein n=1 Tax=Vibrio mediterranei TaxID=689 RepID=A0A3G4VCR3_9VIBR|nr:MULTISPECIES: methionine ABC transporter ATP-binding protein MetN [Vibrio]AYV22049.1 D-methionine ABC transporter, ATP-binding protein [Vibrio mediterranei]EDL50994.1 DL-methionine transporter ATP-binding subunit [Vibrio mediterranei AK1]MCG9664432.1 methionine ABC transporter ATP-binding protein MetN [Vibrio mediterranei]MDA0109499.1 methionine ABC transporter ATP-binding protein MetN [Vibrio sp. La 4.2.2]NUW71486.1 methionine ABC transporter ATP-binding protein MetN [Vibrio mediterranei]
MIEINQVNKVFYQGTKEINALSDINLHIAEGTIFGVIGSSGAGKSTLIRCVNMLEAPTSGAVIVDGIDLTKLSKSELSETRRNIGMIFQHFNLLSSRTVFENVALPLELAGKASSDIENKVSELLKLVGLADKRDTYPANLSGGQKQRVAIARALASDPKVLLCDEATSALDPATTQSILELLKEINRKLKITMLLITHEMDVVKSICHEVAIIGDGRLVEKGTVGEIFAHPKTELAHEFIRSTLDLSIPEDYQARLQTERVEGSYPLVRLEFTGATVDAPLMTQIARKYNIDVSILSSDLDYAGGVKFGMMVAELFGNESDDNAAIQYLRDHNVKVEVLGYVL